MYVDAQNRFPHAAYMDPTARVYGEVEIGENQGALVQNGLRS